MLYREQLFGVHSLAFLGDWKITHVWELLNYCQNVRISICTVKNSYASTLPHRPRCTNNINRMRPHSEWWNVKYALPQKCHLRRGNEMTFHELGARSADPSFVPNRKLSVIIVLMASLDRSDWSVAWSAGKLMRRHFVQCKPSYFPSWDSHSTEGSSETGKSLRSSAIKMLNQGALRVLSRKQHNDRSIS